MNKESLKVAINSIYSLIVPFIVGFMGFWVTPYLLNKLTPEVYGIWVLIASIIGPLALMEFGVSEAIAKFVATSEEKNDTKLSNRIIESTIFFNVIVSLIGLIIITTIAYYLPLLGFGIPNDYLLLSQKAFFIAGLNFAVIRFIGVFEGIFKAIQDFRTISFVTTTGRILYSIAGVLAASLEFGLVGVVAFQAVSYVIILIIWFNQLRIKRPQFSFKPKFHREEFLLTFKYGSWNTLGRVASIMMKNMDKILLASFLSISLVGYFNTAWILSISSFIIVLPFSNSLLPYFSILDGRKNKNLLHERLAYSTWLLSNLTILISIPLFIFSHEILSLWINAECANYMENPLRFLILANWVSSLNIGLGQFIMGVDLVRENTIWLWARGIISITLTFFFIKHFGVHTAGLGYFISQFSIAWLIFIVWKKRFHKKIDFVDFIRGFLQPLASGFFVMYILLIIKSAIGMQITSLLILVFCLLITGIISVILTILINLLFEKDRKKINNTVLLLSFLFRYLIEKIRPN